MPGDVRAVKLDSSGDVVSGSFSLPAGSLAARYLESLACGAEEPPVDLAGARTVSDCEPAGRFLTVLTRTCGDRPELLSQALSCLAEQDCDDFELLLVVHNAPDEAVDATVALALSADPALAARTRVVALTGGGRSHPLNVGFALARTPYVAVLDDDDLVSPDWVFAFKAGAADNPGAIVHARCHAQRWTRGGEARPTGPLDATYCVSFDALAQTAVNRCPIMTLCYPRWCFSDFGLRFGEGLSTNEDWGFLMRAAALCGVAEVEAVTSTYRLWDDAVNSYSATDGTEWDANRMSVEAVCDKAPLLLPAGSFSRMARAADAVLGNPRIDESLTTLYVDNGSGFSQDLIATRPAHVHDALTSFSILTFNGLERFGDIAAVRFDPGESAPVTLEGLELVAVHADGSRERLAVSGGNGLEDGDRLVFVAPDPQVSARLRAPARIAALEASFAFRPSVDADLAARMVKGFGRRGLFGRR